MLLDVAAFAWARPQAAPLLPPPADRATVCNHRTACVYGDGVETKLYQPKKKEAVSAEDPQSQAMFGELLIYIYNYYPARTGWSRIQT